MEEYLPEMHTKHIVIFSLFAHQFSFKTLFILILVRAFYNSQVGFRYTIAGFSGIKLFFVCEKTLYTKLEHVSLKNQMYVGFQEVGNFKVCRKTVIQKANYYQNAQVIKF